MAVLGASVKHQARKLPVIILADVSTSMQAPLQQGEGRAIDALNRGIKDLIAICAEPGGEAETWIAVVAFGGEHAELVMPYTVAGSAHWTEMATRGATPLGSALRMAVDLLEDESVMTRRDYRPIIVLCTDAQPNDDWQPALEALNVAGRAGKADRFAIAIGKADEAMLNRFLAPALKSNEAVGKLFFAGKEREVYQAFKLISQTAAVRSRSRSPDEKPAIGMYDPAAPA